MATPLFWDEDFSAFTQGDALSRPGASASADVNARATIAEINNALKAAWLVGRDPVSRTATVTTTLSAATITTSDAVFTANDVGASITGTGIPASTTIASVQSTTGATMSAAATAAGTVTATVAKTDVGVTGMGLPVGQGAAVWDGATGRFCCYQAIPDVAGGTTIDTQLRTAVQQILTALRGDGVIVGGSSGFNASVWDSVKSMFTFSAYTSPTGGTTIDAPARTWCDTVATALKGAGLLAG